MSMSYGMSPEGCTSIVYPEDMKSKRQKALEMKRLKCERNKAKCTKTSRRIPRDQLMTHDQWLEKEEAMKKQKIQEEKEEDFKNFKNPKICSKFGTKNKLFKPTCKKCPFINKLQTILENSGEYTDTDLEECRKGFVECHKELAENENFTECPKFVACQKEFGECGKDLCKDVLEDIHRHILAEEEAVGGMSVLDTSEDEKSPSPVIGSPGSKCEKQQQSVCKLINEVEYAE